MKKKRGGTHVGFMLSFVIFVVFLIFIYSILIEPTITQSDKKSALENLKIRLIEKVSEDLTSTAVNLKISNPSENCIELKNFISQAEISPNIISKNNNNVLQSYVSSNNLKIERWSSEIFFKIYYSKEFEALSSGGSNCKRVNENQYAIGLIKVEEYVFENKIIDLINSYKVDYEQLKEELKIPFGSDFGFGFTYGNGTLITTNTK